MGDPNTEREPLEVLAAMNGVANEADLLNTRFSNPIGLDDTDGQNLSSAEDLAKLGLFAIRNEFIREVVRLRDFELRDIDVKYSRKLLNTNKLLTEIPGTIGNKNGYNNWRR